MVSKIFDSGFVTFSTASPIPLEAPSNSFSLPFFFAFPFAILPRRTWSLFNSPCFLRISAIFIVVFLIIITSFKRGSPFFLDPLFFVPVSVSVSSALGSILCPLPGNNLDVLTFLDDGLDAGLGLILDDFIFVFFTLNFLPLSFLCTLLNSLNTASAAPLSPPPPILWAAIFSFNMVIYSPYVKSPVKSIPSAFSTAGSIVSSTSFSSELSKLRGLTVRLDSFLPSSLMDFSSSSRFILSRSLL